MKRLEPPDTHYLSSATGWLGLGDAQEAWLDLERISPGSRAHPDVLEVEYDVFAVQKHWLQATAIANALTQAAPKRAIGWVHQAFALHELKRTEEARDTLKGVLGKFEGDWLIRYNLACYECQLGNNDAALGWLNTAAQLGKRSEIRAMALEDHDLEPLWPVIRKPGRRGI